MLHKSPAQTAFAVPKLHPIFHPVCRSLLIYNVRHAIHTYLVGRCCSIVPCLGWLGWGQDMLWVGIALDCSSPVDFQQLQKSQRTFFIRTQPPTFHLLKVHHKNSHSLSLYSLSLSLCLCFSLSLSFCLSVSLSLIHTLSLCLSVCPSLSLSLSTTYT